MNKQTNEKKLFYEITRKQTVLATGIILGCSAALGKILFQNPEITVETCALGFGAIGTLLSVSRKLAYTVIVLFCMCLWAFGFWATFVEDAGVLGLYFMAIGAMIIWEVLKKNQNYRNRCTRDTIDNLFKNNSAEE